MICFKCLAVSHRMHQCQELDAAAKEAAMRIQEKMDEVKSVMATCDAVLYEVKGAMQLTKAAENRARLEVESFFEEAHKTLEARRKALNGELEDMCRQRLDELSSVCRSVTSAKGAAEKSLREADEALKSNSDSHIIAAQSCMELVKPVDSGIRPFELRVHLEKEAALKTLREIGRVFGVSVSGERSSVTGDALTRVLIGRVGKFEVTLRDSEGQVIDNDQVPLTVEIEASESKQQIDAQVKYVGSAKRECSFTLPEQYRGTYSVAVKCCGIHLDKSPYQGEVLEVSKDHSLVQGEGLTRIPKGSRSGQFEVTLKDSRGRVVDVADIPLSVRVTWVESKEQVESSLCYLGSGSHRCTFTVPSTGKYTVNVSCLGVALCHSEGECEADMSWMDQTAQLRRIPGSRIVLAVSESDVFDPDKQYEVPVGFRWAKASEYVVNAVKEFHHHGIGGWSGYTWKGKEKHFFQFQDSKTANKCIHAGNYIGTVRSVFGTSQWAGLVLIEQ
eukprot:TRINITY_DN1943_c0_g1_i7.p1 TRINITY_DN1943_c0_g1~~TRINITY_DN1943_c0_g1_i7.p1  ORF type:complete len:502 (+),score=113.51 TRINITY_DN1943_c0_g1_i7:282-1787(+)